MFSAFGGEKSVFRRFIFNKFSALDGMSAERHPVVAPLVEFVSPPFTHFAPPVVAERVPSRPAGGPKRETSFDPHLQILAQVSCLVKKKNRLRKGVVPPGSERVAFREGPRTYRTGPRYAR